MVWWKILPYPSFPYPNMSISLLLLQLLKIIALGFITTENISYSSNVIVMRGLG